METNGTFALCVPLDASAIKNRPPRAAVKVAVFDSSGTAQERVVNFDADGQARAAFSFGARPGVVRVVVGPEQATASQLQNLQTIGITVSPGALRERDELTLAPIVISAYYWDWWLIWCREFTIRGRVVCADGSPVPGAQVCAYDVHWWWWWVSEDLVGCATTDATGAFEIDFRWCCGWWPWWWWAQRIWRLDPLLLQTILPVLQRAPGIARIPAPSPTPDLAVFNSLLSPGVSALSTNPSRATTAAARKQQAVRPQPINPEAIAALRSRLLAVLPASPELAQLRIWPWWPWEPWFDCDPDIIFKVTQNCAGQNSVIVSETILDTRWDIPTTLTVTLVANQQACCITNPCPDVRACPQGDCLVISEICDDTIDDIGGNPGAPATPVGYLNPGLVSYVGDRPYAGGVPITGTFGSGATADYYAFEYMGGSVTNWTPVPPTSMGGYSCTFWGPGLPSGPVGFQTVNFPATVIGGQLVIETVAHFQANNDPASWGVTRFWTSCSPASQPLMNWNTNGLMPDGTYQLRVRSWTLVGGALEDSTILPLCDTEDDNGVFVTLDNQVVTSQPTNLDGVPCGPPTVHLCTNEPDTDFVQVRINGSAVSGCANVNASNGGSLEIDFMAYDPDGHLAYYTLQALYGDSLVVDLLSVPGAVLSAGPATGPVPSSGPEVGPDYGTALGQGAVSPFWQGGVITLTIPDLSNAFPETCCYTLQLFAYKRTVVSCYDGFAHYNQSDFSLTVVV